MSCGMMHTERQGDDVETDDSFAFHAGTTHLVNIKLAFAPPSTPIPRRCSISSTATSPRPRLIGGEVHILRRAFARLKAGGYFRRQNEKFYLSAMEMCCVE